MRDTFGLAEILISARSQARSDPATAGLSRPGKPNVQFASQPDVQFVSRRLCAMFQPVSRVLYVQTVSQPLSNRIHANRSSKGSGSVVQFVSLSDSRSSGRL